MRFLTLPYALLVLSPLVWATFRKPKPKYPECMDHVGIQLTQMGYDVSTMRLIKVEKLSRREEKLTVSVRVQSDYGAPNKMFIINCTKLVQFIASLIQ